jgi:hypothetical protein
LTPAGAFNTPRRLTKFDLGQLALCRAAAPRVAFVRWKDPRDLNNRSA